METEDLGGRSDVTPPPPGVCCTTQKVGENGDREETFEKKVFQFFI